MVRNSDREQARASRRWVSTLLAGAVCTLATGTPATAAKVDSAATAQARNLGSLSLLDQYGQTIRLPSKDHPEAVVLEAGVVPSYLAYKVNDGVTFPKGFPTVYTGHANDAVGPLNLDTLVQQKLDIVLNRSGRAAVHTPEQTYLVRPVDSAFTSSAGGTVSPVKVWHADKAAIDDTTKAQSQLLTASNSNSTSTTTTKTVAAQTLIPESITSPKILKDLSHLLQFKGGKFVNWNSQSLNALKNDLTLSSPKDVSSHPAVKNTKPAVAAQMLDASTASGTPQPAPVPEPSTLVVFGIALGALGVSRRRGLRSRGERA